jgi:ribulose 1,5-bisphosphate synthetase/thiazole synthase
MHIVFSWEDEPMCPFCISALALVAAKAIAATGGGAVVARVVVSKMRKGDDSSATHFPEGQQSTVRN